MTDIATDPASMLIDPRDIEIFSRGNGVRTYPYVGRWNTSAAAVTTGITEFAVGAALPLHSHNVEESVLVLEGLARVTIGDEHFDVDAGAGTWVPATVPHCFANRGDSTMRIFWVYGGSYVTRTVTATGETFEHLSESDRIGIGPPAP